jgi:hypothetical protein
MTVYLELRGFRRLYAGSHRKLGETIHAMGFLSANEVTWIEPFHLSREPGIERCAVK